MSKWGDEDHRLPWSRHRSSEALAAWKRWVVFMDHQIRHHQLSWTTLSSPWTCCLSQRQSQSSESKWLKGHHLAAVVPASSRRRVDTDVRALILAPMNLVSSARCACIVDFLLASLLGQRRLQHRSPQWLASLQEVNRQCQFRFNTTALILRLQPRKLQIRNSRRPWASRLHNQPTGIKEVILLCRRSPSSTRPQKLKWLRSIMNSRIEIWTRWMMIFTDKSTRSDSRWHRLRASWTEQLLRLKSKSNQSLRRLPKCANNFSTKSWILARIKTQIHQQPDKLTEGKITPSKMKSINNKLKSSTKT